MYEKTTANIKISVEPSYRADQSEPDEHRFVWAYRVQIENKGQESVRLRSRYWRITDSNGSVQEVSGEGVVGDQPFLKPGDSYEYTSGAPLTTPGGFMVGNYTMEGDNGRQFIVDIPAFSLDSPHQRAVMN